MSKQTSEIKAIAVITKDIIGDGERNDKKLYLSNESDLKKRYFKLYDDDDILYYKGYFYDDPYCDNQEELLNWAMSDSGCTMIKVSDDNRKFELEID